MADYYHATITYRCGDRKCLVHKGKEPSRATMKLLGRIGAIIEVGEPVAPETEEIYQKYAAAAAAARRAGWHPQMDVPETDDE